MEKAILSKERTGTYHTSALAVSVDFNRIFYCNGILFLNSGLSNVLINDVFLLVPDASLEITGNQNEVDLTAYKVFFRGSGVNLLQMFIKMDDGIWTEFTKYPWNAFYTKEPNKKGFVPAGMSRLTEAARRGTGAQKGDRNNISHRKAPSDF